MKHWMAMALAALALAAGCGEDKLATAPTDAAVSADAGSTGTGSDVAAADSSAPGNADAAAPDAGPPPADAVADSPPPEDVATVPEDDILGPKGFETVAKHPPGERGICDPCAASKDCADPFGSCVGLGDPAGANGYFCEASCTPTGGCGEGSHCQARTTTEGEVTLVCVPDTNQCACSPAAAKGGWSTPCFVASFDKLGLVAGKCGGTWSCASGGCNAAQPKNEICNGKDDNCNGQTDEQAGDKPQDNLCDDGNPCTTGEKCEGGKCTLGANQCACNNDNDCADQDVCQGKWWCDKSTPQWKCKVQANTAPNCGKLQTDACMAASCDSKKGCITVPKTDGTACNADNNNCTASDACKGGVCKAGAMIACDDANPCTFDQCTATGCTHVATAGACDDGNKCTGEDTCKKGVCTGTAAACNDNNPCTADACDPATGQCGASAGADGGNCDDGDPCTTADACKSGACAGGKALACDDGNPCTDDSCEKGKGCATAANTASCDDGNTCTKGDTCAAGACKGGASVCGCQSQADCDDQQKANPCLGAMVCNLVANPPACQPKPGAAPPCPDGGPCTVATCSEGKCGTAAKTDGATCNDGNACTSNDTCKAGACAGSGVSCDDGNPCTDDSCAIAGGVATCKHANSTAPCSDNNACTVGDTCGVGKCVAGGAKDCADTASCTIDSCDSKTGDCKHDTSILQGKSCGTGDGACGPAVCSGAVCTLQSASACDDGNPCTNDSCKPDAGCQHLNNTNACDDGNPCTLSDTCSNAACKGPKANPCDDSNVCTDDSCAPATGCQHAANTKPCDDGDLCTEKDTCADKACGGTKKNCGDGNPCTVSTCDKGICSAPVNKPDKTVCQGKGACNGTATCLAGTCIDPPGTCPDVKGHEIIPPTIPDVFQIAKTLFDPIGVHELKLVVADSDWQAYMALVAKQQKGTIWWPAKTTFDGKDYGTTGIRPFGFGSLFTNPQKPNIRVKFDAQTPDNFGPDEVHSLRFKPSGQDNTWLKQILGPVIIQQIGGYAPRYSWARVWVNGQPFGLYQMLENVDKHFYKVNFGNNDGNEYQRKNSCVGFNCPAAGCAGLANIYVGDPGAATEIVAIGQMVKTEPEATWPGKLDQAIDLKSLYAEYAWEAIGSDIDTLAAAGQNFTMYMNQETAKMEFIPTGEDLVCGTNGAWYNLWSPWGPPNSWCKNRTDDLFTRMAATPAIKTQMATVMQKAHCGPFATKTFQPMIEAYKKLLWNDLTNDPKGFLTPALIDKAYAALIKYVQDRNVYLDAQLGVCP